MQHPKTRRSFLRTTVSAAAAGGGVGGGTEGRPRGRSPPMMIAELRRGLPYRHFVAALFLANVRTLGMGHPLVAVHAANQLALDVPGQERLLPMFWALDSFKYHQERGREAPHVRPLAGNLPSAEQAAAELHAGMREFDRDRV